MQLAYNLENKMGHACNHYRLIIILYHCDDDGNRYRLECLCMKIYSEHSTNLNLRID